MKFALCPYMEDLLAPEKNLEEGVAFLTNLPTTAQAPRNFSCFCEATF